MQGITNFGPSSVDIGIICKVRPMKQWEVERGIRLAVKEMFDKSGVEFPYPHMVTVPYQKPQEVVGREDIFVQKQQPEQECASWQSIDADDLEL